MVSSIFRRALPFLAAGILISPLSLSAQDPSSSEEIMNATPGKAFDRESKINPTVYLCDPMRFAIRAYRHYLQEGYGDKFLYRVLSGKALAE